AVEVLAPNREAALQVEERFGKLTEVSSVRSIDFFVPQDQKTKLAAIQEAAKALGPTFQEPKLKPPTDAENVSALKEAAADLNKTATGKTGVGADAMKRLADSIAKLASGTEAQRSKAQE